MTEEQLQEEAQTEVWRERRKKLWLAFCEEQGIDVSAVRPDHFGRPVFDAFIDLLDQIDEYFINRWWKINEEVRRLGD
jgi:hypothetical protein